MENLEIRITAKVYQYSELPEEDRKLVEAAKEMTHKSYAPYSRFHVGAAILLANGVIVTGANQENAAYPSGTCAERSACFNAGANYPGVAMKKIAIAAWNQNLNPEGTDPSEISFQDEPISPCGACRQALLEYESLHGPIEVILYGRNRTLVLPSVASLLPFSFITF